MNVPTLLLHPEARRLPLGVGLDHATRACHCVFVLGILQFQKRKPEQKGRLNSYVRKLNISSDSKVTIAYINYIPRMCGVFLDTCRGQVAASGEQDGSGPGA